MSVLRHPIRLLLKSPGFTITAIFSLINAVVLKPIPYSHPERLVKVVLPYQNAMADNFDYPDYLDVAAAQTCLDSTMLIHGDFLDLTGSGEPQRLFVNFVSPSVFTFTGRPAILGRTFNTQEDIQHGPLLAVISESFWRNHFNSDPNVIGKAITLSEQTFEIIGLAPAQMDISGPPPTDVYLPVNSTLLFGYSLYQRTRYKKRKSKTTARSQGQQDRPLNRS